MFGAAVSRVWSRQAGLSSGEGADSGSIGAPLGRGLRGPSQDCRSVFMSMLRLFLIEQNWIFCPSPEACGHLIRARSIPSLVLESSRPFPEGSRERPSTAVPHSTEPGAQTSWPKDPGRCCAVDEAVPECWAKSDCVHRGSSLPEEPGVRWRRGHPAVSTVLFWFWVFSVFLCVAISG